MVPPIPINPTSASPIVLAIFALAVVSMYGSGMSIGSGVAMNESMDYQHTREDISSIPDDTLSEIRTNDTYYENRPLDVETDRKINTGVARAVLPVYEYLMVKPTLLGMGYGYQHPTAGMYLGPALSWGPVLLLGYWGYVSIKGYVEVLKCVL